MARDFDYLLKKHGREGSRQVFEDACAKAFSKEFEDAFPIECNPGDEGIDVFVGDFSEKIDVYQCKCFFYEIGDSQVSQINSSFKKATESKEYKLKKWVLCVPKSLTIQEAKWWSKWKKRKEEKFKIKVDLMDSVKLLNLITKHNLHLEIFDEEELILLNQILDELTTKKQRLKEIFEVPVEMDFSDKLFTLKLKSANINEHLDVFNKQFFNAEILTKEVESRNIQNELKELKSLRSVLNEVWLTQYMLYDDEFDGNRLLAIVNKRIEDLNDKDILKTKLDISSSEKKGIMHQLADECTVGWVKNYKERLKEFLK
ncbi:ABC-three component system protein [Mesoflavibacter sp. CH_XMU1422-2]|uniref:ABC-three component system protein n=1 Tax=Mesoflavibacter sp. CH_XMU1422-2 TaxID=3107770 RepID=UPI00300BF44F